MLKRLLLLVLPLALVAGLLHSFDVVDLAALVAGEDEEAFDGYDYALADGPALADDERTGRITLSGTNGGRSRRGPHAGTTGTDDTADKMPAPPGSLQIHGRVMAPGGRAAKEARILATGPAGIAELTTDAEGRFKGGLVPGRYRVYIDGGADGALLIRNFMVDGSKTDEIELTLRPTARFELTVARGSEMVEGVALRLEASKMEAASGTVFEGVTNARGVATFEALPLSRYALEGTLPDGLPFEQTVNVSSDRGITIQVPGGVRFHGTVRADSTDGPGIGGANVHLEIQGFKSTAMFHLDITTERDGSFEAMVPQGGLKALTVTAEGYAAGPDTRNAERAVRRAYYQARNTLWRGKETRYDLALTGGSSVSGLVTDTEDKPLASVRLQVRSRYGVEETVTGENGRYQFQNLNPSRYELRILTEKLFPLEPLSFQVKKKQVEPVQFDFTLERSRSFRGVVQNSTGAPVAGARVYVTGGGRLLRSARDTARTLEVWTNTQGQWLLEDVPTSVSISLRATMGGLEALAQHIPANETPSEAIILKLDETGHVEGVLTDARNGRPISGARVIFLPVGEPSGRPARNGWTNGKGAYKVANLLPGTWTVQPDKRGYPKMEPAEHKLSAGEAAQRMDLTIDPGPVIEGTVTASNGKPLHNARVYASGQMPGGKTWRRSLRTDKNGEFRFLGLPDLIFRVQVRAGKHKTWTEQGVRTDNGRLRVQLQAN